MGFEFPRVSMSSFLSSKACSASTESSSTVISSALFLKRFLKRSNRPMQYLSRRESGRCRACASFLAQRILSRRMLCEQAPHFAVSRTVSPRRLR